MTPGLTPYERDALTRLLATRRKGGEGWHPDSSASEQVRDMLEAGETRNARDDDMMNLALRLQEGAGV